MKIYDIEKLDPKEVMYWFKQFSSIPHGTYHEDAVSTWVAETLKKAGATVTKYPRGLVLAKIDATKGYEKAPIVMLQSHLDMVLAKTTTCSKDLLKDPITPYYDSETGKVRAEETSLGADDGLGVATMLAIAHDKTLKHGKLELVFSTKEEDDPGTCIEDMKPDDLEATYYFNLDGDSIDSLIYGGAGGTNIKYQEPLKFISKPANYETIKIELDGLTGGHSGIHINTPHINAITFLSETLLNFADENKTQIGLVNISGGPINNAIPLFSSATIQIEKVHSSKLEKYLKEKLALAKSVAQGKEENARFNISKINSIKQMLPFDLSRRILLIGDLAPNKVFTEKLDHTAMYSSSNFGVIKIENNKLLWEFKVRSFVNEEIYRVARQIVNLNSVLGFNNYVYQGPLSAFINDISNNKAAILWEKIHNKVTGRKLNKFATAGGLESASFCKVNPAMTENTVIVNATVLQEHSTNEAFVLKDLQEFWKIIKKVLEEIK